MARVFLESLLSFVYVYIIKLDETRGVTPVHTIDRGIFEVGMVNRVVEKRVVERINEFRLRE